MKEPYGKGLANRSAPNPTPAMVTTRVWHGQGVHAGQALSSEILPLACPHCPDGGRQHGTRRSGESCRNAAESETLCMCGNSSRENRESLSVSVRPHRPTERSENVSGGNADMNADRKSDVPIVPAKRTNKTGAPAAESVEERGAPKGNVMPVLLVPDTVPDHARHRWHSRATGRGSVVLLRSPQPKGGAV